MTSNILVRPEQPFWGISTHDIAAELRCDPTIMKEVERSTQAWLEGKVKPWSQVKRELGIR